MLSIFADMEPLGLSKLSEFGIVGIFLMLCISALVYTVRNDRTNLVDWRVEARNDLKEERASRQAYETAMTKLMGELLAQASDTKDAMTEIKNAMERTAQAINNMLEEMKRLKNG